MMTLSQKKGLSGDVSANAKMFSINVLTITIDYLKSFKGEINKYSMSNTNDIADYVIIYQALSKIECKHVAKALSILYKDRSIVHTTSGLDTANWIVLDTGPVMTHVILSEVEEYYKLKDFLLSRL